MAEIPALVGARSGVTANGVPFVALPPAGDRAARGVVVLWHGADAPRSEAALAGAVPMGTLPAWRVYLGLPLWGQRTPAEGVEAFMARAAEDEVTHLFHPSITGAVAELPAALADVRARLGIDPALPLGVFGFSKGGAAALLALSRRVLPFKAAVTYGAVIDFHALMDSLAVLFGTTYEWTDARRALAEEISSGGRAGALAGSGAAILLGLGSADPLPVRAPAEQLVQGIRAAGGTAEARILPGLAHGFVDEPGVEAAPQGPPARAVNALASEWFERYLW
jgi:dienelactone hydrolase